MRGPLSYPEEILMRRLLLAVGLVAGFLTLAVPQAAPAQVRLSLHMGFPRVLPPLVQVEPGVRVVQDFDDEVFFINGWYFVERDGNWYRTRDHRGTWRYVKPAGLPAALAHHEPGRYRHWQHDDRRTWPDARADRRRARHWRPADHRERHAAPPGHGPDRDRGRGGDGERGGPDRH
jgi:hypothetical protein